MYTLLMGGDEGEILGQLIFNIIRENVVPAVCQATLLIMSASFLWYFVRIYFVLP